MWSECAASWPHSPALTLWVTASEGTGAQEHERQPVWLIRNPSTSCFNRSGPAATHSVPWTCLHLLLAGANTTWWNVYASGFKATQLPECQFGPFLNFFGWWTAPKGSRRLLAVEGKASSEERSGKLPQPAQGDSGRVAAQSTAWCSREGWWVEQVSSGRTITPTDLHGAQVAARQGGRMR